MIILINHRHSLNHLLILKSYNYDRALYSEGPQRRPAISESWITLRLFISQALASPKNLQLFIHYRDLGLETWRLKEGRPGGIISKLKDQERGVGKRRQDNHQHEKHCCLKKLISSHHTWLIDCTGTRCSLSSTPRLASTLPLTFFPSSLTTADSPIPLWWIVLTFLMSKC